MTRTSQEAIAHFMDGFIAVGMLLILFVTITKGSMKPVSVSDLVTNCIWDAGWIVAFFTSNSTRDLPWVIRFLLIGSYFVYVAAVWQWAELEARAAPLLLGVPFGALLTFYLVLYVVTVRKHRREMREDAQ